MGEAVKQDMACALKLVWILFFNQTSIWSDWYITEVLKGNLDQFLVINTKQKLSWLGNQLIRLRDVAYPWIKMVIGNGERTYFWSSNWSGHGKLSEFLANEGRSRFGIPKDVTMAELWTTTGWSLPHARSEKQIAILSELSTITVSLTEDYYIWAPNNVRKVRYKTGEIYDLIRQRGTEVDWFKEVWIKGGIPRQMFLFWIFTLNRCPTRDRLIKWQLPTNGNCLLCNGAAEDRSHLFFDCYFSWDIWQTLALKCGFISARQWDLLLPQIKTSNIGKIKKKLLLMVLHSTVYHVWQERNNRLHKNEFKSVQTLLKFIDLQMRNRISSIRLDSPEHASKLMQL